MHGSLSQIPGASFSSKESNGRIAAWVKLFDPILKGCRLNGNNTCDSGDVRLEMGFLYHQRMNRVTRMDICTTATTYNRPSNCPSPYTSIRHTAMTSKSPIAHRENRSHAYPNAQTTHPITVPKEAPPANSSSTLRYIETSNRLSPYTIHLLSTWAFLKYKD
ncbi:uncharacterized protein EAE97_005160 [Botrytis byssoidea]|uniref:Uncharacterized protein n=1 Tax=Botrytis byssoidea TaxID=139641 RepID=A0A9P5IJX6_9HELO|nr:uncharacterized protein EAE97_005160 [Botrytis byssoidea]KAF7944527.1 hypothetical protein EAE97_005160 [Botrytis byssoidea]